MKLNMVERLNLLNILPPEGNFVTLRVVRELSKELGYTEAELKEWGIKQNGAQVTWKENLNIDKTEKDIKIGERATDIIVDALKKLDEENKLTQTHFTIYEKFVEGNHDKETDKE